MAEEFKNFDFFVDWCNSQIGFSLDDYQLDKDLLVNGNQCYGPDTCLFLPRKINQVLNKRSSCRGDLPIGVTRVCSKSKPYLAQCNNEHSRYAESFATIEDAFNAYKQEKERYIKYLAILYKGKIDERAVIALLKYEVKRTD
jgi:hypothetical protein